MNATSGTTVTLQPYEDEDRMSDTELGCCRRAVQHRVSAAAAVQSSGGTLLHEYPDFILPFIIQSLAHHPDFPTQEVRCHLFMSAGHSTMLTMQLCLHCHHTTSYHIKQIAWR